MLYCAAVSKQKLSRKGVGTMKHIQHISKIPIKKGIFLVGCVVVVGIAVATIAGFSRPQQEEPIRREYPVSQEDITVGIDAAGNIQSQQWGQFPKVAVKLKEYKVVVGDYVEKDTVLAVYDEDDIDRLTREANTKLTEKQNELSRLESQKSSAQSQLQQKIDQLRSSGSEAPNTELQTMEQQQKELELQISQEQKNSEIAQLEKNDLLQQKEQRPAVLAEWDAKLHQLEEEQKTLQEELNQLVEQGAGEETLQPIRQKLAENDVSIVDIQRKREVLLDTDYETLIADKQTQIDTAIAAQETAKQKLEQTKLAIEQEKQKRESVRKTEDQQIEALKKQTQEEIKLMDGQIKAAQEQRNQAKKEYEELLEIKNDPTLKADRSGVVKELGAAPGTISDPSSPLVKIGDEGQRNLILQIDPVDVGQVEIGQDVSFYVDAYPEATFHGTVKSISHIQNDMGKFEVRANFEAGSQPLLDGMGANATLIVKQKKDVLSLANKAIQFNEGKSFVYLLNEEGQLYQQEIVTGFSNGRVTEIKEGLQSGDVVIVEEVYEAR